MTDYGHDLQFGSFLTPTAERPQVAVELARVSELAGLDLVTFQDHPYQPAFLDTWTLLSYVAAQTEHVTIAPNVANLPLRPPAMLAQAAASLDLLSNGRVALALGAGAFWDAVEAMGGPRRTPGEAVEAMEEALTIIRAKWDTQTRGGVREEGTHYRVTGAKRGPAPAHEVPIWVGAYKPRMLRLAGRLADGVLPSLGYLSGPGDLGPINESVDEGAAAVGREPAHVRRLLNIGTGDLDPRFLTELTLEHGISTFVLGSDDPDVLTRFGREVAPEVRELVTRARSQGLAGPAREQPRTADSSGPLGVAATPDDGVRRAASGSWDESTRPTAPAEPAGEYTDQGRAVAQHLVEVHDGLRGELAQLRDLVEQVRGGLAPGTARSQLHEMTMRQNNWTLGAYCASYCRIVTGHHALEDAQIFPHLRSQDTDLRPVIDRLEEEHRTIHDVLDGVDRALVRLAGDPRDLAPLEEAVDLVTDTLLSHLSYEERELLGPLARLGFYEGQV